MNKKENIGRYTRTAEHRKKAAKAAKKYWSSVRRSKAMKKAWSAKKKSAKMKQVWAEKKANQVPFGKWKPAAFQPGMVADEADYTAPAQDLSILARMQQEAAEGAKTPFRLLSPEQKRAYWRKINAARRLRLGMKPRKVKADSYNRCSEDVRRALLEVQSKRKPKAKVIDAPAACGCGCNDDGPTPKDWTALNQLFAIRDLMQTVLKAFDQGITRLEAQVRK